MNLINTLSTIGLSEREAAVYVAALELGPSGALALSRRSRIHRSLVYDTLESLKLKGLMRIEHRGLKKLFAPASPDQLDAIMSDHKRLYGAALPELMALYTLRGEKSHIKYFEGPSGLRTVYEQLLREVRTGDPFYLIARQENWQANLDLSWLEDFIERRARKQLDTRIIFEDSERGRLNKRMEVAWNQKVRLTKQKFESDIIVTPQRFITYGFELPIQVVVVENPSIIRTQLDLFRYIWDTLPD